MAFSSAAEIKKTFISLKTKEALKARKAKGIKLGKPHGAGKSGSDPHKEEIIAQKFIVTPATLHNWIGKNKVKPLKISLI